MNHLTKTITKWLVLSVLILVFGTEAFADTSLDYSGRLIDTNTNQPVTSGVVDIMVQIVDPNAPTCVLYQNFYQRTPDSDGNFKISVTGVSVVGGGSVGVSLQNVLNSRNTAGVNCHNSSGVVGAPFVPSGSDPSARQLQVSIYNTAATPSAAWEQIDEQLLRPAYEASNALMLSGATLGTGAGDIVRLNGSAQIPAALLPALVAGDLPNTAVAPGTYGASSYVPTFTVDQQGRLTSAGSTQISLNANQITAGTLNSAVLGASGVVAGSAGSGTSVPVVTVDASGRVTSLSSTAISFPALSAITELTGDVTASGSGTVSASISAGVITNTQISGTAAIADSKLATITTANKVSNSATTAASANTANAIVARDAQGNFSAGTISAARFSGTVSASDIVGTLSPLRGGTGLDASLAGNGQLLIGNGAGFTLGTLNAGANIQINNQAGTITISSSNGGGTVTQVEAGAGLAGGVINSTGTISLPTLGVVTTVNTSNYIPTISIDTFGRVTTLGSSAVSFPALQWTNVALGINYATGGSVGIGVAAPAVKLDVAGAIKIANESAACAAGFAGAIRYSGGLIQYCDGVTPGWVTLGVSGSGLQSLNGLIANNQVFAVGSAGTSAAFTSAGTLHTLDIPMASTSGAVGGLISNADYLALTAGTIPAARVGDLPADKVTSGTFAVARIPSLDASKIVSGTLATSVLGVVPGANGGTVTQVNTGAGLEGGPFSTVGTISLGTSGVVAGSYGSAGWIPTYTVDTYGRITSTSTVEVSINASRLTSGTLDTARLGVSGVVPGTVNTTNYVPTLSVDIYGRVTSLGSSAVSIAAGLQNLNGLAANDQFFALGSSGTVAAFNSAGSIHTLNIPLASTAGAVGGLISNADYLTLTAGTIPAARVGDLPADKVTSGTFAVARIPNLDASKIVSGTLATAVLGVVPGANGGTVTQVNTGAGLQGGPFSAVGTISLATSGVTAGTVNTTNYIPTLSVDTYGRVTTLGSAAVSFPALQWTDVALGINYATGGSVGIGVAAPAVKLDVNGAIKIANESASCAGGFAGAIRYNASVLEYCNGVGPGWIALGASGSGLQSLNGLVANNQYFTVGSAGTSAAFSSAGTMHTLNIPMASAAGAVGGLLSNTDYLTLTAGTIPAARVGDLSADKITSGTLAAARIGILPNANGGTGLNTSTASSGQLLIGNGSGFTLGTLVSGSNVQIVNQAGTITISSTNSGGTVTQVNTGTGLSGGPFSNVGTLSLANTAVTPGTYGSGSQISTFTVDQQGRLTAAATTAVSISASQITSGTLGVARGGTGLVPAGAADANKVYGLDSSGNAPEFKVIAQGAGINVNNTAGTITISATGAGSVTSVAAGAGLTGGTITSTGTIGLPTLLTAGSVGTASFIPAINFDSFGRITSVGSTAISINMSAITGTLGVAQGGTGLDGSGAFNGALLMGTGSGFTLGTLRASPNSGITVSTATGTLAIGSNAQVTAVNDSLVIRDNNASFAANKGTFNSVDLNNAGALVTLSNPAGATYSMILPPNMGATGQVLSTNGTSLLSWVNALTSSGTHNFIAQNGLDSAPSIRFAGDLDTGLYSAAAGTVDFTTNGTRRLSVTDNGIQLANGAVGAPSVSFLNEAATGLYRAGLGTLGISISGSNRLSLDANQMLMNGRAGFGTNAVSAGTQLEVYGGAIKSVGTTEGGELRMGELLTNGTNWIAFRSPNSVTQNYTMILPGTIGTSGQVLTTDGTNTLSWTTPASGITNIDGLSDAIYNTTASSLYLGLSAGTLQTNSNQNNVAVGAEALNQMTVSSSGNTAIGYRAGASTGTVNSGTFLGYLAGQYVAGAGNTALGNGAISLNNVVGDNNVAVGKDALYNISGFATGNIGLGYRAGQNITTGSDNILIGVQMNAPNPTGSNQLVIGNLIYGTGITVNTTVAENGKIGIGTSAISAGTRFEVAGGAIKAVGTAGGGELRLGEQLSTGTNWISFRAPTSIDQNYSMILPGTIGTPGQVLTTDGTGGLSWTNVSAGITYPLLSTTRGSVATPAYSFSSDSDTGIFSPGANTLSISTSGTEAIRVDSAGFVGIGMKGIGTLGPFAPLHTYGTAVLNAGSLTYASRTDLVTVNTGLTPVGRADGGNIVHRFRSNTALGTGPFYSGTIGGLSVLAQQETVTHLNELVGVDAKATRTSDGNIYNAIGVRANVEQSSTINSMTNAYGVYSRVAIVGGSQNIQNAYGLYTTIGTTNGNVINSYGLYVGTLAVAPGGSTYSVFSVGTLAKAYFAGSMGLGVLNPAEKLDVAGNIRLTEVGGQTSSLRFMDGNSTNSVGFRAPINVGTDVTWILPSSDGGPGNVLATSGGGSLSWAAPGGLTGFYGTIASAIPNNATNVSAFVSNAGSTNADVALVTKGNGALLAQVPDNSPTGGNKRGIYATDWQRDRTDANDIALGMFSVVSGGRSNASIGSLSVVAGGFENTANGVFSSIGGGNTNFIGVSADYSVIAGGGTNTIATGISNASIIGGQNNTANGSGSVVGGLGNTANTFAQTSLGAYSQTLTGSAGSWIETDPLFVLGNGSMASARSNAMVVLKNGNVGFGTVATSARLEVAGGGVVIHGSSGAGNSGELRLGELSGAGGQFFSLRAPDALSADVDLVLPTTSGTNGQMIVTNGSGQLGWATPPTGTVYNCPVNWTKVNAGTPREFCVSRSQGSSGFTTFVSVSNMCTGIPLGAGVTATLCNVDQMVSACMQSALRDAGGAFYSGPALSSNFSNSVTAQSMRGSCTSGAPNTHNYGVSNVVGTDNVFCCF